MNSSADEKAIVQDMKVASLEVLRRTAQDVFHEKILVSNLIKQVPPPKNADNDDDDENDIADNQNNTNNNNNTHNNNTHHNIIPNNDILNDIRVHKIDEQDMVIGRVLGRGAFCVVKECSCPIFSFSNAYSVGGETNRSFSSKLSSFSLSARYNRIMSKNSKKNTTSGNGMRSEPRDGDKNNSSGAFSNGNGIVSETSSLSTGSIGCNNDQNHHNKKIASSRSSPGGRKNGSSGRKKYKTRYVMKQISSDLKRSDKINFLKGTVDLAMETRFLASIQHENVISLRGISNNGAFSDGYFIILERLNETLGQKVKGWMDMDRQCKGITGVFTGSKKKAHKLQMERISAAYDLAAAMEYLHQKDIVFRDLKPDNVGFDSNGILKIFDFGLAKELRDDERTEDGLYKMTGCTGSIRYMSPENAQWKPYNLSTDVYSWAMIMWNILALEPPFALYTEQMIIDRVCNRGYRPKIFSTWSSRMSKIIGRSWSANTKDRPSFEEISVQLKAERDEIESKYIVEKKGNKCNPKSMKTTCTSSISNRD